MANPQLKSLQHATLDAIFDSYFKDAADDYLVKYAETHPHIFDKYLTTTVMYYVYLRQSDRVLDPEGNDSHEIHQVATFATFNAAEHWILEHGRMLIKNHKQNMDKLTPLVLCII